MSRVGSRLGRLLVSLSFLTLLLLAAGCGEVNKASTIPEETTVEAVVSRLRTAWVEVEWASFSWRPDFFGPSVRQASLSVGGPGGSHVQFYRFDEAGQAAEAAAGVSREGNAVPTDRGTAMVSWAGPPHFFREGRLIALFVQGADSDLSGSLDRRVLKALREVMGPQFAGATSALQ